MKKVLLSLLAVAALVLSCQNYDDEFDALNSKIASLESQITSLADLRTAVTGVQSSISALQTAVASAQAAAEAADNSDAITALATSVAAIAADLVDLQTAIDGATTDADLDALKTELNTTLAALQTLIETNSASIASLVTSNSDLRAALDELGVDVTSILASNATFEGNLRITNDAELAYAKSLGNKVATIKGDVYVQVDAFKHTSGGDGSGLTAAEINSVLSQISYVVGNVKIDTDESLDLSKLTSITGDYIVVNHDVSDDNLLMVGGNVHFDYDGPYSSKIQTVGNIYLVMHEDADAATDGSTVAKVGTTSIDFLALTKALGVQSVSAAEKNAHTSGASLTYGSTEADGAISVASVTTSVKIGQAPVASVVSGTTAATTALTAVELHYLADLGATASGLNPSGVSALSSLTITGAELATVTVKAKQITGNVDVDAQAGTATSNSAVIDLSSLLSVGGKITSDASSNTLTSLKTVSGIRLSEQKVVSLPALTASSSSLASDKTTLSKDGSIQLDEATSFSAPLLAKVGTTGVEAIVSPLSFTNAELRGDITANLVEGAVSLPALTLAGDLNFAAATSLSAPLAVINTVDIAASATSIAIASVADPATGIVDLATIKSLTLNAQKAQLDVVNGAIVYQSTSSRAVGTEEFHGAAELTSLTFKGARPTNATTAADQDFFVDESLDSYNLLKLTSLTLGGALRTVDLDLTASGVEANGARTALATITTEGTIASFTVRDGFDLTTLTLGHTEENFVLTPATLKIINNRKLNSITTTQTMVHVLEITGNSSLSNLNLSSLNKIPNNIVKDAGSAGSVGSTTAISVYIYNNHLAPDHFDELSTSSNAATAGTLAKTVSNWDGLLGAYQATTPSVARSYSQSGLATLANFISAIDAKYTDSAPIADDYPTLDFKLGYKYQSGDETVGDIVISQAAISINLDGSASSSTSSVSATVTAADNLLLLAELKLLQ